MKIKTLMVLLVAVAFVFAISCKKKSKETAQEKAEVKVQAEAVEKTESAKIAGSETKTTTAGEAGGKAVTVEAGAKSEIGGGQELPLLSSETLAPGGNIALLELGASIESATSEYDVEWTAPMVLDGNPEQAWSSADLKNPQEIIISFFNRQPVLISAIAINPGRRGRKSWEEQFAKDVEVWTSMAGPTEGFTKLGGITLRQEPVDQLLNFPPTDARFIKVKFLSNYGNKDYVMCGDIKIIEAQRPGYKSLLDRNPELVALASGRIPWPLVPTPIAARTSKGCGCAQLSSMVPKEPAHNESRNVLVVMNDTDRTRSDKAPSEYPPTKFLPTDSQGGFDYSIYGRLRFKIVRPIAARPALLASAEGFDTVVLAQVCKIKNEIADSFKKVLLVWLSQGHKLIIQDSDYCSVSPDYSFLPYSFVTSNVGAKGAKSDALVPLEDNTLASSRPADAAFVDIESWLDSKDGTANEIGDSNVIHKYDTNWCGYFFTINFNEVGGFVGAYAHYGRGLIIYDGFDIDQYKGAAYRKLVTRELLQPFDPDGLPCTIQLADFVITTERQLMRQPMVPGRTYTYPLTLYSNQGYKGAVNLSLITTPSDPGLTFGFQPAAVPLEKTAKAILTVSASSAASPNPHTLAVCGTDANGLTTTLCLELAERKTGGIQVVGELQRDKKSTKNLEIILDSSGSMKLALGKKTRWATALDVLEQVLKKLPDDFNVGLRIYGHRESSLSPKTCTDSELVVPIGKLDRSRILSAARAVKPKGETPLVYSVLQTPEDLKTVGGGAVVLITDGEESCKGDVKAAAQQIRQSSLDVMVNIVGFTLTGKQTQEELATLAEGTGGHYYAAQSGEALARALLIAAVEKFPFEIRDSSGKVLVKGEAGGAPEELPPGDYAVVITAGDQVLTQQVTVVSGADVILRVRLKEDKFVVER